ncbi:MAG: radical SAM family heme chaperone HemW [Polyangia bacterium]
MFGVYIHFPYCQQRCPYCDFAVAVRQKIPHERYLRATRAELAAKAALFPDRRAVSVYFGGGTPSLWRPDCVAAALAEVLAAFPPAAGARPEVTLECDPHGVSDEQLAALRAAGINRLSIGAQSLQPRHLVSLGRQHQAGDVLDVVRRARALGYDNLSLDLMIGLIDQRPDELDDDLGRLVALRPEHLSLYQLTVEPGTALAARVRRAEVQPPDEGAQADAYDRVRTLLAAAGYLHYEISSFARRDPDGGRDLRAVHNRLYWTSGEYLGLGVGAHSFRRLDGARGGERFGNDRGVESYLKLWAPPDAAPPASFLPSESAPGLGLYEHHDPEALAREALWLGLRALDGLSCARFAAVHGYDPRQRHAEPLARLAARGLLALDPDGDRLCLTARGALFADEVGASLL